MVHACLSVQIAGDEGVELGGEHADDGLAIGDGHGLRICDDQGTGSGDLEVDAIEQVCVALVDVLCEGRDVRLWRCPQWRCS